jgi:hypothetical protein
VTLWLQRIALASLCSAALVLGIAVLWQTLTMQAVRSVTVAGPVQQPAPTQLVRVVVEYPTPTSTPYPTQTPTPYPVPSPLPTWGGQQDSGLYVIEPAPPTPRPPVVHQVCVKATPVTGSPLVCLGLPFRLPGGWFA